MSRTRRLTTLSLLTAVALIMFIIEAQLPPLTAIPGIKLGLSNIVTLVAMYLIGPAGAAMTLAARIVLGAIATGQVGAMAYSLTGAAAAYAALLFLRRVFALRQLWVASVFCAVVHNWGQILAAVFITGTPELWRYGLILTASGIVTGLFTGLAAQAALQQLCKTGGWFYRKK